MTIRKARVFRRNSIEKETNIGFVFVQFISWNAL